MKVWAASTFFSKKIDQMVWFLWSFQIIICHSVFCIIWWFCWFACQTKMCDLESKCWENSQTQFSLKDRSEGKVPNCALDTRSRYRLYRWDFAFCLFLIFNAQYLMRGFYFCTQSPSCHTEFTRVESVENVQVLAGWKLLTFRYFWKVSCHFVSFIVFIQF